MGMNATIKSVADLKLEILRLKALQNQQEEILLNDLNEIKNSLKPANLVINTVSSLFANKERSGILSNGFYYGIGFVVEKILLRKSTGVSKYILAYLLQNLAVNLSEEKSDTIKSTLRNYLRKLKDNLPFSKDKNPEMEVEAGTEV